ncbi:MAG: deoxyribose-phosphate aldolase [Candidatus Bathyarchaeia archaeon]
MKFSKIELAKMIDSTLVKPNVTKKDVAKLCEDALKYGFKCVVVNPIHVGFAAQLVRDTDVKVCSTIGFPFGITLPEVKALEAKKAVENGAAELDMVINISALKSKDYETVKKDITAVIDTKRNYGDVVVKVIIETLYLSDEEKVVACKLSKEAGADFVKTSTGLLGGKATVEDVRLMRETVGEEMGVKAAGGIRTLKDVLAMIEAGANRIGTSTATQIIEEIT